MIAARIHKYGGPEELLLEEVERPLLKPNQILIRVAAVAVNPVDWKLCSGAFHERFPQEMPCQLGADVAGTVCEIGADQTVFQTGDRVFAMVGLTGAYAELVAVDASFVARSPDSLDDVRAASVPLVALTAWQGLFQHGDLRSGQSVLVNGAAGGVGMFAVQFAKPVGARVCATASDKNSSFVRDLGADEVFDYRAAETRQHPRDLDLVIDAVGDDPVRLLSVVKDGGAMIQVSPGRAPDLRSKAEERGVQLIAFQVRPDGVQLRVIADQIDAGKVSTHVSKVMPFADIAQAHSLSRDGHVRGKIVLKL